MPVVVDQVEEGALFPVRRVPSSPTAVLVILLVATMLPLLPLPVVFSGGDWLGLYEEAETKCGRQGGEARQKAAPAATGGIEQSHADQCAIVVHELPSSCRVAGMNPGRQSLDPN